MTSKQFQKYRLSLGFTQEELSKKMHVKYWTLVKWENGSSIPECCQYLFHVLYPDTVPFSSRCIPEDEKTLDLPFRL